MKNENDVFKKSEEVIVDCLKQFINNTDVFFAISKVLQRILGYYDGDRIYVYKIRDLKFCLISEIDAIQKSKRFSDEISNSWIEFDNEQKILFQNNGSCIYKPQISKSEFNLDSRYDMLTNDYVNVLYMPFYRENVLCGFIGIDNPKVNLEYKNVLEILTYNIFSKLEYLEQVNNITAVKKELEKSERIKDIAIRQSDMIIWIYNVLTMKNSFDIEINKEEKLHNDNYSDSETIINNGFIHKDSIIDFRELYKGAKHGKISKVIRVLDNQRVEYRWKRMSFTPIYEADNGTFTFTIGTSIDITDEIGAKQRYEYEITKRKLLESNVILSLMINLSTDRVMEYNSFKISPTNSMTEYTGEEYLEYALQFIYDDDNRKELINLMKVELLRKKYTADEKNMYLEYRRYVQSELRWVSLSVQITKNPVSDDIIAFLYVRDINEAKLRELIMKKILYDNVDYASYIEIANKTEYLVFDSEDNQDNVIEGDLYETKLCKYNIKNIHSDDLDKYIQNTKLETIIEMLEKSNSFLFNIRLKDGSVKSLLFSYLYENTKDIIIVKGSDVTSIYREEQARRKELEIALNKANKANQAKNEFFSRISHDIRTPMNVIIGMVNQSREYSNQNELMNSYLDKISSASEFLLGLVNDIIDVTKIENGWLTIMPESCRLKDVVGDINTLASQMAHDKGISFTITDESLSDTVINIDRQRFMQIIFNLLSNSFKFTAKKGEVKLILYEKKVDEKRVKVNINVIDNGRGISKEFLPKIYDAFEQELGEVRDVKSGSGLGLAIVKQLTELMNGTIDVESERNVGTKFSLSFNFEISDEKVKAKEEVCDINRINLNNISVLIAEDNDLNREILSCMLKKYGMEVTEAVNGEELINKFVVSEPNKYDMIITDIRMPIIDGLTAVRNIRRINRTDAKKIPIIAVTANAFEEDIKKSEESGINAHICKPVKADKLIQTIAGLIK